jgi:hypothetical protein
MPLKYLHSNKYLHNSHQYINMDYIMELLCLSEMATREDPRHVGAPHNAYSLHVFVLGEGWWTFLRVCAATADHFK